MTAKQRLLDKVEAFSEDQAVEALVLLGLDGGEELRDFPPAPAPVMEKFRRAMAESEAGRPITDEEFGRRFALD